MVARTITLIGSLGVMLVSSCYSKPHRVSTEFEAREVARKSISKLNGNGLPKPEDLRYEWLLESPQGQDVNKRHWTLIYSVDPVSYGGNYVIWVWVSEGGLVTAEGLPEAVPSGARSRCARSAAEEWTCQG